MPELANISVGSFRGTSGLLSTTRWPFFSKYVRNVDRMSFRLGMIGFLGWRDPDC